ncbi:uncharacterized protein [Dermacentor andersoni]|uniref:uncharacterized protein isoform X2 n=1 Tax=Dermacentor andersoni TaxID=34620 RepID=UPI00241715CC|nr:protein FAM184A-like isoform X2 [Dermacentor andersoni]
MKMPADCMSPELFTKMAEKIAQLTKVVYTLNMRAEDQETLMSAMKELHEEDVKRVTRDANEKMAHCQSQVSRQVALLEGALVRERQERWRLEGELHRQLLPAGHLVTLCAEMRAASIVLRSKLDAFERLQLHVALSLEGLPVSAGVPGTTSRAIVGGRVEDDCILRKNDFLRDHCDQLAEENQRMRVHFECQLTQLRSFYEEKLHSSRRLQLGNDASLMEEKHASRVDALLLHLAHSEQQLDRYCKEAKALSDELEKREKHLKMMDDQVCGSEQVLLRLTGRLKQSEAASNQLKASCALYKQDAIAKADRIASLEATASEQQCRIEQLQAEALELAPLRAQCDAQLERVAQAEAALAKHQADKHRELLANQQKLEALERRLKTFKDESKCLKLIQAQLKESLSEANYRICLLNSEVDQKVEALIKKEQELSSLREGMKKLKWELTEALQEKEAALWDSRRLLQRAFIEMNAALESKIKLSPPDSCSCLTLPTEHQHCIGRPSHSVAGELSEKFSLCNGHVLVELFPACYVFLDIYEITERQTLQTWELEGFNDCPCWPFANLYFANWN